MPRSRKSRYASDYQALLKLLGEAREKAGITQIELAKRTQTSQSMLSKLERGVVRMDITDLLDYLRGIEADPVKFFAAFVQEVGWKRATKGTSR